MGLERHLKTFIDLNGSFGRWYLGTFGYSGISLSILFFFFGLSGLGKLKSKFAKKGLLCFLWLFINVFLTSGLIKQFWPGMAIDLGGSLGMSAFKLGTEFVSFMGMTGLLLFLWIWFFLNLSGMTFQEVLFKRVPRLFRRRIKVKVSKGAKRVIGEGKGESRSRIDRNRGKVEEELRERVPEIWRICQENLARRYRYLFPSLDC